MNRRTFLRGTLLSVAGSQALVRLATPAESEALIPQRALVLGHPQPELDPTTAFMDAPEVYMRRPQDGAFICIGICTKIEVHTPTFDSSSAWDGEVRLIPGLKRGKLFFEGQR